MADRATLLNQTAQAVIQASAVGVLGRQAIQILHAETVAGPRAGAVRFYAGLASGTLYRALSVDNVAVGRQFIAWPFPGEPAVYLDGRAVRLEAPWPPELAQDCIRLSAVNHRPRHNGQWVLGVNEVGQTVIPALDDRTPHWLVAGTTGSGKTVGMLSAGLQLAQDRNNHLVLVDGKMGAGLGQLVGLPGVVGPLAVDIAAVRSALGWVCGELARRYQAIASAHDPQEVQKFPRLVILFDEFQEFTGDPVVAGLLRRILSMGRAAKIHAILATQHPTVAAFGEDGSLKRNLPGRIALKVLDAKASEVVVGASNPRADHLTGAGDAYAIGGAGIHRTQLVLVDERDLNSAPREPAALAEWPEFQAEDLGQEPTVQWAYTGEELAHALNAARQDWGRPRLQEALGLAGLSRPGSNRAQRLLDLGREQLDSLENLGLMLAASNVVSGQVLQVRQG
jgi:hypothetical protein